IAVIEALLAGLPCILSEGVGTAAAVAKAGGALLVGTDASGIAFAITSLLTQDERRREMGDKGRAFAQVEYSTGKMVERLVELYQRVARGSGEGT
ncbi:MAG: hypothetical protein JWM36_995, partial [Hyphomicrobiales bacterium]|nr:hypothetical protein [Hyphomicrobiales bacterium]